MIRHVPVALTAGQARALMTAARCVLNSAEPVRALNFGELRALSLGCSALETAIREIGFADQLFTIRGILAAADSEFGDRDLALKQIRFVLREDQP